MRLLQFIVINSKVWLLITWTSGNITSGHHSFWLLDDAAREYHTVLGICIS